MNNRKGNYWWGLGSYRVNCSVCLFLKELSVSHFFTNENSIVCMCMYVYYSKSCANFLFLLLIYLFDFQALQECPWEVLLQVCGLQTWVLLEGAWCLLVCLPLAWCHQGWEGPLGECHHQVLWVEVRNSTLISIVVVLFFPSLNSQRQSTCNISSHCEYFISKYVVEIDKLIRWWVLFWWIAQFS